MEIGDLSTYNGIEEFNFNGLFVKPAIVLNKSIDAKKLSRVDFYHLYKKGIGYIRLNKYDNAAYSDYPINLINSQKTYSPQINIEEPANMIISNSRNHVKYLIINGFIYDFRHDNNFIPNGIVIM